MNSKDKTYDVIVVGSGPVGVTIARELGKLRKKVLMLERGAKTPSKESFLEFASIARSVPVGEKINTINVSAIGGGTGAYFAIAKYPPLDVFLSLGIDLHQELEEVKRELPIRQLPDERLGTQTVKVRESAIALGYPWKKKLMLIEQSQCASTYSYDAKWKANSYLEEAVLAGIDFVSRARVMKVIVENNRAIGVEYRHKTKSNTEILHAYGTKIILATGSLSTPVILRDCGIENVADRGFYCDPSSAVFGIVPGLKGDDCFVGSMGTDFEDGIALGDLNFSRTFYRMLMLGQRRLIRFFLHSKTIGVGVMVKDELGGELDEDGKYRKELTDEEQEKLKIGEEAAIKIIQNAGGKHIIRCKPSSAHLGGMLRIQEHVNEKLETEIENLHVCDGSLIPESVRAPPTLTLICLGKYLARQIAPLL